jgi:hypothetical protein
MIKTILGGKGLSCSHASSSGKRKANSMNFFIGFDLLNVLQIIKFQSIMGFNFLQIKS